MLVLVTSWVLPFTDPNVNEQQEEKLICVDCDLNCSKLSKGGICPDCIKNPKKYFLPYPSAAIYRRVLWLKQELVFFGCHKFFENKITKKLL